MSESVHAEFSKNLIFFLRATKRLPKIFKILSNSFKISNTLQESIKGAPCAANNQ